MAEYINRAELIENLNKFAPEHYNALINQIITKQPTADVVEVVRCKDCDVPHNKWLGCPNLNGLIPPPDFYCAKGTPKERGKRK